MATVVLFAGCTDWEHLSRDYGAAGTPTKACATFVVTGDTHTCVRHASGEVTCWGDNRFGQLGTGDERSRPTPTLIAFGGNNTAKLYAPVGTGDISLDDARFTCAITTDEHLYCWGNDHFGLGTGVERTSSVPLLVDLPAAAKAASGSGHTCVQMTDASLYCWGNNLQGQLGLGDTQSRLKPERVDVDGRALERINAGSDFTCAGTASGTVYCWGGNAHGQLGLGNTRRQTKPALVNGISGVARIATGAAHTCVIDGNGRVVCWGDNRSGQLGSGDVEERHSPTPIEAADFRTSNVNQLFAGGSHSCAIRDDNTLWCWGGNRFGQLGTGDTDVRTTPTQVLADVSAAYTGGAHTCAVKTDGSVWCWGNNQYGQLGVDVGQQSFVPVEAIPACQ